MGLWRAVSAAVCGVALVTLSSAVCLADKPVIPTTTTTLTVSETSLPKDSATVLTLTSRTTCSDSTLSIGVGSVHFALDGSVLIAKVTPSSSGDASCQTTIGAAGLNLAPGDHVFTAHYIGKGTIPDSWSAEVHLLVTSPVTDHVAPSTQVTYVPDPANGSSGWYVGPVSVRLTATDAGGSGVACVRYRINGGPVESEPGDVAVVDLLEDGLYYVEFSAVDNAGNEEFVDQDATWAKARLIGIDQTAPSLGDCADMTAEATGPDGATVSFSLPTGADDGSGLARVTSDPVPGSLLPLGESTIAVTATDIAGNSTTKTFTVTVRDTTPPALTDVPGDMTVEATGPAGATVTFAPGTAYDLVDGAVSVSADPVPGSEFALGSTTVTVTAIDKAGNTGSASFTVTVVDTTPPVVTVPANITAEATSAAGASVTFSVSAQDVVDGSVLATAVPASGITFALGDTIVTVTATDRAGNTESASFTVTVADTTPPVLSNVPSDMVVQATSTSGAVVTFASPTATDIVDGVFTPAVTPSSGSTFPLGTTTVSVVATDNAGNSATASFKVTVAYGWSGFLQPINSDNTSVFKLGSTVPVKFQLTGASAGITNGSFKLYYAKVTNNVTGTELEAGSTSAATTGNLFRYDATANQYIFNWGTKGLTVGTYELRADLGDGVARTVRVSLR